jgi:hypothetical protein
MKETDMPLAKSSFIVRGHGPFPIDMLRYDSAWPSTSENAAKLTDTFVQHPYTLGQRREAWEIELWSADPRAPTIGRWLSFNVRLVS